MRAKTKSWQAKSRRQGRAESLLAFTTYQAGKLFLIGLQPDGRLSVHDRNFERIMGLAASQDSLWMTTLYQIWRFSNFLDPGGVHDGHYAL